MSSIRPNYNDEIEIEKSDGRRVIGRFKRMDETFVKVRGTVGDNIGKEILVPMALVSQIVTIQRADAEDER